MLILFRQFRTSLLGWIRSLHKWIRSLCGWIRPSRWIRSWRGLIRLSGCRWILLSRGRVLGRLGRLNRLGRLSKLWVIS